jgi:two-component system nitrate/nitrite response regulator NarL
MSWRVLLIDDHPLFRKGVAGLIEDDDELELVGEAGDGASGIELARRTDPDIILVDLHMKTMDGLETLRRLKALDLRARCVVLTASDSEQDVAAAMRSGADGYLIKELEPEDLCPRIKQAYRGTLVIEGHTPGLLQALTAPAAAERPDLTLREAQTLQLLSQGLSNKEIGRELGISDETVKVHIKKLLRKLNLRSRLEAAVWALQHPDPAAAQSG